MKKQNKAVPIAVLRLLAQWALERCERAKQGKQQPAARQKTRITMAIDTMTIAQFIEENRIVSGSYRVDSNPSMPDSANMDHWKVTLRRAGHTMTVFFSKGYGHHGAEPATDEVLSSLASDSSSVDDYSFDDWCSNLGFETDSRKAEKTFKVCQHQAKRLQNFLGVDLYGQLLYSVEGL